MRSVISFICLLAIALSSHAALSSDLILSDGRWASVLRLDPEDGGSAIECVSPAQIHATLRDLRRQLGGIRVARSSVGLSGWMVDCTTGERGGLDLLKRAAEHNLALAHRLNSPTELRVELQEEEAGFHSRLILRGSGWEQVFEPATDKELRSFLAFFGENVPEFGVSASVCTPSGWTVVCQPGGDGGLALALEAARFDRELAQKFDAPCRIVVERRDGPEHPETRILVEKRNGIVELVPHSTTELNALFDDWRKRAPDLGIASSIVTSTGWRVVCDRSGSRGLGLAKDAAAYNLALDRPQDCAGKGTAGRP